MQRSKMADISKAFIICFVCKAFSTVIELNVWLWNRIRIADCFAALMLPEALIQQTRTRSRYVLNSAVGFQSFDFCGPSFLRPLVFEVKTLQKNRSKHFDCGSEEHLGSFFFK